MVVGEGAEGRGDARMGGDWEFGDVVQFTQKRSRRAPSGARILHVELRPLIGICRREVAIVMILCTFLISRLGRHKVGFVVATLEEVMALVIAGDSESDEQQAAIPSLDS